MAAVPQLKMNAEIKGLILSNIVFSLLSLDKNMENVFTMTITIFAFAFSF